MYKLNKADHMIFFNVETFFKQTKLYNKTQLLYMYLQKTKSKGSVIEFSLVTSNLFCYYFA